MNYIRNCPICNKLINYKNYNSYRVCKVKNTSCKQCGLNLRDNKRKQKISILLNEGLFPSPKNNIIGKTKNCWEIIEFVGREKFSKKECCWKTKCINCGKISIKRNYDINKIKKCKYCSLMAKGQTGLNALFNTYKIHAKNNKREFSLNLEEFNRLTSSNCYYCNAKPSQISTKNLNNWGEYIYNGIDRINNSIGYKIENCVSCCNICNWGKNNKSSEEFKQYILGIYNNINININNTKIELPFIYTTNHVKSNYLNDSPKPKNDLTGKIINCWEILEFAGRKIISNSKFCYWKTKCINCGIIFDKEISHINKTKICGHCKCLPRGQTGLNKLFYSYSNSKKEFSLKLEDFNRLTSSNCYYCNARPSKISFNTKSNNWGAYIYNGIDRMNNSIGYIIENCVSCCAICNWAKNNRDINEFKQYISNVYQNVADKTIPFMLLENN